LEYEDAFVKLSYDQISSNVSAFDNHPDKSIFRVDGNSPIEVLQHMIALANYNVTLVLGDAEHEFLEKSDHLNGLKVVFTTSGTTGNPKLVSQDFINLVSGIKQKNQDSERFLKWGFLYDPTKMAGIQVMLSAFTRGEPLYCPDVSESISNRIKFLLERQVNAISATPSMWRAMLQIQDFHQLSLIQITLGGEKVEGALLETLKAVFPLAKITQIYATSELGVVFSVQDGLEGFPLAFIQGVSDQSSFLKIDDAGGLQVFSNGIWVNTGDRVEISGQRVLFSGRFDEIVNVGGVKIDPEKVRKAIMELPDVLDAVVSGVANPILGQILIAEVVLRELSEITENDIKTHLQKRIKRIELPAMVRIVELVSLNSNGKRRLSI
jgi:acyl-coenzyme A synthetase/AMP-(fatty) acid ligase